MNILLIPEQCENLSPVKLPDPKTGELQQYYYDEGNLCLYESMRYHDKFRSWLLDDQFCKEGHMNMLTKMDTLYIFLPILEKFASKQFKTLDDIISTYKSNSEDQDIRLDFALSPDIDWQNICETRDVDGDLFIKYSESNALDWLKKKHIATMDVLKDLIDGESSKATLLSYGLDLIDLYLPPTISDKFKAHCRNNPIPAVVSSKGTKNVGRTNNHHEVKNDSTTTNGGASSDNDKAKKQQKTQNGQASIMSFFTKKSK